MAVECLTIKSLTCWDEVCWGNIQVSVLTEDSLVRHQVYPEAGTRPFWSGCQDGDIYPTMHHDIIRTRHSFGQK